MGNTSDNNKVNKTAGQRKRRLNVGILAHVDAGKTTLSEGMLYLSGSIRDMGRVDHGDAFLDTYEMERERGITIFSKQAVLSWKDIELTLLDTPGHVDFSAEMERVLQVLDYAVLVISGTDGVQGHTVTLWRLLKRYNVPVFLFINKMDREGTDRNALMAELKGRLDEGCTDIEAIRENDPDRLESLAVCDDAMLEEYLETGSICKNTLRRTIAERKVFPCWFGSALKAEGITELLDGIREYSISPEYPEKFGAKVYKIARDPQGNRLTYLKVTGGELKVKELIPGIEGKVNQIRIYSGVRYELVQSAQAGMVCAVTGLEGTYPGQGMGEEKDSDIPVLEPVLTYRVELPEGCDVHTMLTNLRQLEEEEPELHIVWAGETQEIHVQLMGEVQTEVLQRLIKDRYGVLVEFREGRIIYKETIAGPVEGIGHFEPLRHYAEVHLLLEPGERGSGMQFSSECSEDILDRNWQRLILTHLEEKEHRGVLTGSVLTDVRITLVAGRAHQKHTEGGDFRQATYRAVRQGLMKAESVLLEPYYEFRMELPMENVGRAMTDIQRMNGTFEGPEAENDQAVLTGSAPVSEMRGYQKEFAAYTGGFGRLFCTLKGYDVCHDAENVVGEISYDPDSDIDNTADSVFCAHGAGFIVPWYQVEEYMHVESKMKDAEEQGEGTDRRQAARLVRAQAASRTIELTREELDAIYVRTPDPVRKNVSSTPVKVSATSEDDRWRNRDTSADRKKKTSGEEYLLVDGYNIIFAWDELRELSEIDLAAARGRLADILCNYQGYRKCTLILVFDAYKVEGNPGEVAKYHNIHIVYTKEAETADQYIEKTVRKISKHHSVTVATSDALEQVIILGQGARRMSAAGLKEEVELALREIRGEHLEKGDILRTYLFDYLGEDTAKEMEEIRLGKGNWPV
ncbi:TetM/TetW/TetO/TetS family tetracycline resistance ribosomal protection protein [Mediterraneibacter glycyrrhizinilyticus]|uniref:translation factor GTPase family protein n=1 Tax=Mediterraneibacter glycyrrhizinilyticus TaxID=342942 RepID=UPI0025AA706F|nr:TetM/TetW/TetO/TetS family tetracycline resistance ribosomal protection protein [Mediterraneibacter glycyrrhizinilyticus]MDN0059918.1 TetM/TetW/TetO/TetS family tetracycline resistance ribosomal protection protein [Mediterraneibacter glycyrrhizinilyticus]